MDNAAIKKYLSEDFAKAIQFYDDRANRSKLWYRRLSIYLIVVAAILTPLVAFNADCPYLRIVAAALSASIVIATSLLTQLKCHEDWLSYRSSWDALERERRLFETNTGVYASAQDKGALFVERVEGIMAKEGSDFYGRHAKTEEQPKVPPKKNGK